MLFVPAFILSIVFQGAPSRTVWDGAYTDAQAARGEAVYASECSGCHRADLSGYNGALRGNRFMEEWREDRLLSLFTTIKITMPRGAPGSLSDEAYTDIVAYVMQMNEFPSGSGELTAESLAETQLVGRDGPKPLPNSALINVVGCLKRASDGTSDGRWMLERTSDFLRTRNPGESTAAELQAAAERPLGSSMLRLLDIGFSRPFFQPEMHENQKIEAKGFLNRKPGDDRLSLTSLQAVGPACSDGL